MAVPFIPSPEEQAQWAFCVGAALPKPWHLLVKDLHPWCFPKEGSISPELVFKTEIHYRVAKVVLVFAHGTCSSHLGSLAVALHLTQPGQWARATPSPPHRSRASYVKDLRYILACRLQMFCESLFSQSGLYTMPWHSGMSKSHVLWLLIF